MKKFKTINPIDYSTKDLHKILLSSVTPRPIALASTIDTNGAVNLSPFSYFNVFSANPPILIFSPANRVTDNSKKDTLINISKVKEVVINLVDYNIVEPTSLSSVYFEKNIDEFLKSGLTKMESIKVKPPRVLESPVSYECKVNDVISLGNNGGAGNLIICEVLMIHINEEFLNENGDIDPLKLNLVARMGENYYLDVKKDSLFEIKKPVGVNAIGVDLLPNHTSESLILSINDLARLGNIEEIPSLDLINQFKEDHDIKKIISLADHKEKIKLLHLRVKEFLNNDDLNSAVLTLFSI
jgi:flavin reductase (DIM6/NTAB) family NADH-FMN oxidoreductase RutF